MPQRVIVHVPGSTSNLGSGFDCVGLAVNRSLTLAATLSNTTSIERAGKLAAVHVDPADDLILVGFRAACEAAGQPVPHVRIHAGSEIPIARGLGSSAAALVGGAVTANALLGLGLTDAGIARIASTLEGHPDNVTPSVYGGATLIVAGGPGEENLVVELVVNDALCIVIAVPDFEFETSRARALLPEDIPHTTARRAAALSAALVQGLASADARLLAAGLDDVLHVPYRRAHIKGYDDVTAAARSAGAFGATISGAGSSVAAVTPTQNAAAVARAMHDAWRGHGVASDCFTSHGRVPGYTVSKVQREAEVQTNHANR